MNTKFCNHLKKSRADKEEITLLSSLDSHWFHPSKRLSPVTGPLKGTRPTNLVWKAWGELKLTTTVNNNTAPPCFNDSQFFSSYNFHNCVSTSPLLKTILFEDTELWNISKSVLHALRNIVFTQFRNRYSTFFFFTAVPYGALYWKSVLGTMCVEGAPQGRKQ